MAKPFYPYLQVGPRSLKRGQVTFTFAVRQPAESPAPLRVEFRGRGQTQEPGPWIAIGRDGAVEANGELVCTLEPDEWTRFELQFALGDNSSGTYTLAVRDRSGETTQTLPFGRSTFDEIKWLGIITPDDADGTVYLDDLKLQISD